MLKLENITVTFEKGTAGEKKALDDLSLQVNKGEFITIIGANGAGKSTMFNAICGNLITAEGRIILDDKDITMLPEHKRSRQIGRLFQDPSMGTAPNMTIAENLALASKAGTWLSGINSADRRYFSKRLSVLEMGLEDRMDQQVGTLSGGQRQALALLMATINPPALLLLDEHTAALDPAAQEKILKITRQIVEANDLTCLMITHDMSSALELGNRTIMMHEGRIILDISGEERSSVTVDDLLERFREATGKNLNSDRMLLT
ncbi:MAG: ATP-binding cassette domain-containing protein [Erysipelotrichaceae bacterium]|nr:ATP-binding cassette domain-containing protein [Erysipelotrichaceae bacterium]